MAEASREIIVESVEIPVPAPSPSYHKALKWSYLMSWGTQGTNLVVTFVMAALLGPQDFGTVAMATVYILFIEMLFEQGLNAAIVQRKDLQEEHLDSAFWATMAGSVIFCLLSVLFSGWWARINALPVLQPVISILSLTILFKGLTIVQQAVLQRDLDFYHLAIRANVSVLLGGAAGLAAAFAGQGVWALVVQQLTTNLLSLALLWRLSSWRPGLRFSRRHLRDLMGFSLLVLLGKLGHFAGKRMSVIITGLFFGPIAVGLYRLADRLVTLAVDLLANPFAVVALSEFSRSQEDRERLRRRFLRSLRSVSAVMVPAMVFIGVLAEPIMHLLGPRWEKAASGLQALSLTGVLLGFSVFTGPLLHAAGKPQLLTGLLWAFALVNAGALAVTGYLLRGQPPEDQVLEICLAQAAVLLVFLPINTWMNVRAAGVRLSEMGRAVAPAMAAGGAGLGAGLLGRRLVSGVLPPGSLATLVLVGAMVLGVSISLLLALDGEVREQARELVLRRLQGVLQPAKGSVDDDAA